MHKRYSCWLSFIFIFLMSCSSTLTYRVPLAKDQEKADTPIYFGSLLLDESLGLRLVNQRTARIEPKESVQASMAESSSNDLIYMPFNKKNSGQIMAHFGLAIGLVDVAVEASANDEFLKQKERQLAPLKRAISATDLNDIFLNSLNSQVIASPLLKGATSLTPDEVENIRKTPEKRLFNVNTRIIFTSDFSAMQVYTDVIYSKVKDNKLLNKRARGGPMLFRNSYQYVSPKLERAPEFQTKVSNAIQRERSAYQSNIENTIDISKKRFFKRELVRKLRHLQNDFLLEESNLELSRRWSADNARIVKQHLKEAANEIAKMLLVDLADSRATTEQRANNNANEYESGLQIIAESGDRVIVRDVQTARKGQLCSIKKGTPGAYCKFFL